MTGAMNERSQPCRYHSRTHTLYKTARRSYAIEPHTACRVDGTVLEEILKLDPHFSSYLYPLLYTSIVWCPHTSKHPNHKFFGRWNLTPTSLICNTSAGLDPKKKTRTKWTVSTFVRVASSQRCENIFYSILRSLRPFNHLSIKCYWCTTLADPGVQWGPCLQLLIFCYTLYLPII